MSWRAGRRALAWGPWPLGLPSRMPTSGGCVLHLLHPCDCNRQARSIYAEVSVNTKDANEGSEGQGKEKTSARNTRAAKAAVQHLMQITDRVNLRGELRARRQRIEPCEARNAYREDVAFQHMKDRLHKLRGWVIRRDVRENGSLDASEDDAPQPWKLSLSHLHDVGAIADEEYEKELEQKRLEREQRRQG